MKESTKYKEVLDKFISINDNRGIGLFQLGLMYLYGNSYPQDIDKGVKLIERAGPYYPYAYTFLGLAYLNGEIVSKNKTKALAYLNKGKKAGDSEAILQLSNLYFYSDIVPQDIERALDLLSLAIEQGHPEAMLNKGILSLGSSFLPPNYPEAYRLFSKSDELHNFNATAFLGLMYEKGYFVKKDEIKALRLYIKATSGHSPVGHYFLGKMYQNGNVIKANLKEAICHYEIASAYGFNNATHRLIDIYFDENSPEWNVYIGRAYLEKLLDEGDPLAEYKYGKCLIEGRYYKKNIKKGLKYLRKSDTKESLYLLGNIYYHGKIVNRSNNMALFYYLDAAKFGCSVSMYQAAKIIISENLNNEHIILLESAIELGNKEAHYLLGKCYQFGIGVDVDYQKAFKHYTLADNAQGFKALGLCYLHGICCEKNVELAIAYLEKSVELGGIGSTCILGTLYYEGKEIPKDEEKAFYYFNLGVEKGSKDAHYLLGKIYLKYDYTRGIEYLQKAIKLGSKQAKQLYRQINNNH